MSLSSRKDYDGTCTVHTLWNSSNWAELNCQNKQTNKKQTEFWKFKLKQTKLKMFNLTFWKDYYLSNTSFQTQNFIFSSRPGGCTILYLRTYYSNLCQHGRDSVSFQVSNPLMDVHDISDPFFCYFFKFRLFYDTLYEHLWAYDRGRWIKFHSTQERKILYVRERPLMTSFF